jgi:hypothetical protein
LKRVVRSRCPRCADAVNLIGPAASKRARRFFEGASRCDDIIDEPDDASGDPVAQERTANILAPFIAAESCLTWCVANSRKTSRIGA